MGAELSTNAINFLRVKVYAHIATLMKAGSPQVTPLWVDTDGSHILINTSTGRVKTRNIERDGRVALSIMGLESAYRCLWIRGKVVEIKKDNELIDSLSFKYTGHPTYQGYQQGVDRISVKIEPIHVTERGI